ncbi:MAG: hypothetical protein L0G99_11530 [Propionibacteriales bacterium]|nr:hypothetical protein [Propionibacteriales bacterium]
MAPLTILLAPPGVMNGVRDALTDWSANGMCNPFVWVDASTVQPNHVPGIGVFGGRVHGTSVQQVLSGPTQHQQQGHERVRVCVLVPAVGESEPVSAQVEQQVSQLVIATSQTRVELLRCIVTRPDAPPRPEIAHEGWHNVIISPEDSRGPGLGRTVLTGEADAVDLAPYAANVLAALTGLWKNINDAPLDDENPPPGRTVRLARAYYRSHSAEAVSDAVRAGVLYTESGLPLPRQTTGQAVHAEDVGLATSSMANALWTKHRAVLRGPRASLPAEQAEEIGGGRALKMMMGFLWNSIKGSPARWYSGAVHAVSSATAAVTHDMVFGAAPSSYKVVVGGVRADGNPAGWEDLAIASAEMSEVLNQGQPHQEQQYDLSVVMKDYVGGALTLADGGDHASGLPPIQIGADRGVLRQAADCAPGPQDALQIPAHLADQVGHTRLHPSDILGAQAVRGRLQQAGRNEHLAVESDRVAQDIGSWQQRFATSYPVQVGSILVRQIQATAGEVRGLLQGIQQAAHVPDLSGEIQARQRTLAMLIRVILAFLVVFVIADIVVVANQWIDGFTWTIGLWWGLGVFVVCAVAIGILFFVGQRELFGELHRRRIATGQAEVNRENLRNASNDLSRLTELYRHYLVWSRIAGAALHRPFGDGAAAGVDQTPISDGLPMAARMGVAAVQPDTVSRAVVTVRRDLYRIGWMTLPWEQMLADAGERIGPEGYEVTENPERLFAQRPRPESLVTRWADLLEAEGSRTSAGDKVWQYVLQTLDGPQAELKRSLVTQVTVPGSEGAPSMADFMANLDLPDEQLGPQTFDGSVLAVSARMGATARVSRNWRRTAPAGLGQVTVLVQLGDGFPEYELSVLSADTGADQTSSPMSEPGAAEWTF